MNDLSSFTNLSLDEAILLIGKTQESFMGIISILYSVGITWRIASFFLVDIWD